LGCDSVVGLAVPRIPEECIYLHVQLFIFEVVEDLYTA
jgi:hypothetical protein